MVVHRMQRHRGDFANSLVHLTKESSEKTALETLCDILSDGIIKGSGKKGFVKGPNTATCFTETPLSSLKHFASEKDAEEARYRFYGIAISKHTGFSQGVRPVIYLPDEEAKWIPEEHKWRHVRFEHGGVDWTHEREWRGIGDFDLSKAIGIYVICWHSNEIE